MNKNLYFPIVIAGPSGSGKTVLTQEFIDSRKDSFEAVGYTTRSKRPGEIDGKDYNFTNRTEFNKLWESGILLEKQEYAGNLYGMPKSELETKDQFAVFNVGFNAVKKIKEYRPDTKTIYLLPPNKEELLRRLGDRGIERYIVAQDEVKEAIGLFDYFVVSEGNVMERFEDIITNNGEKYLLKNHINFILNFFN